MLEEITPLILTYNESPNIDRTLQRLVWAKRIVIVDSYSNDLTLEIVKVYTQVEVFKREFDSFANQCNFGLSKITTHWVLSLDADYILSDSLLDEIETLCPDNLADGYFVRFKYCVFGKPLRATLLPPRQVLYRREKAQYQEDGHAHRVKVQGRSQTLKSYIYHDDRKPLTRWLWAQDRYLQIEAKKLTETPFKALSWSDKIRTFKFIAPLLIFLYCLIWKRGLLDGWRGWYYAYQRMIAELMLALRLMELEQVCTQENLGDRG